MQKNKVEMTCEVNGRPMRELAHEGRTYVESREGTEYSIRLTNNTGGRVLAVLSVDGVNTISGKPTSDDPSEAGYVLGAGESHVIKGYRVDENTAANFKFVKREGSYATEKAKGQGNGVIAVRVWEEKAKKEDMAALWRKLYEEEAKKPTKKEYIPLPYPVYPYRPRPYWTRDYWYEPVWVSNPSTWVSTADCSGGTIGATYDATVQALNSVGNDASDCLRGAAMSLSSRCVNNEASAQFVACAVAEANPFAHGSTFGEAVQDKVKEVEFETGMFLVELCIYYAPLEGLKALGVDVTKTKAVSFPEPFKRGFCPPPSGWKKSD